MWSWDAIFVPLSENVTCKDHYNLTNPPDALENLIFDSAVVYIRAWMYLSRTEETSQACCNIARDLSKCRHLNPLITLPCMIYE